jgi:hypothetical protein
MFSWLSSSQYKDTLAFWIPTAAFLIDGIQNHRTPPDWMYAHEKRLERDRWEREKAQADREELPLRQQYEQERTASWKAFLASAEGRQKYEQAFQPLVAFYKVTEPHRFREAANEAALARLERLDFHFPDYSVWAGMTRTASTMQTKR